MNKQAHYARLIASPLFAQTASPLANDGHRISNHEVTIIEDEIGIRSGSLQLGIQERDSTKLFVEDLPRKGGLWIMRRVSRKHQRKGMVPL
jgi:hypothetical protein